MKAKTLIVYDYFKQEYTVTIEKNKSIKIDCFYKNRHNPQETSTAFKMGDTAEYSSYNLSYMGIIIGITEKTVSIKCDSDKSIRRLKLSQFCWRNWDFNLEKKLAYNEEERTYI